MKQAALSILFPYQDRVTYREIPEESWHDLGLDALTEKVASQPQEVPLLGNGWPSCWTRSRCSMTTAW